MGLISIIDYGMGNLRSVQKALEHIGEEAVITNNKEIIMKSSGIIVPGVGAFPDAMENLKNTGMDKVIISAAKENKPLLGICLGMQLFFESSDEVTLETGLGILKGKVTKLEGDIKIPHMGWNSLNIKRMSPILKGTTQGSFVYFVHSFYVSSICSESLNAACSYGVEIPAVISLNNVFGMQFHPEKSGEAGINMLRNFAAISKGTIYRRNFNGYISSN